MVTHAIEQAHALDKTLELSIELERCEYRSEPRLSLGTFGGLSSTARAGDNYKLPVVVYKEEDYAPT